MTDETSAAGGGISQDDKREPGAGSPSPSSPRPEVKHDRPHAFRLAVEARDVQAAVDALAPDVVLHSPVTARPFKGRAAVAPLLRMLLTEELAYIRCIDEVRHDNTLVLRFRLGIGGQDVEVVDWMLLDEHDKVTEYRVFARPLAGAAGYLAAMGPRVAAQQGRWRGVLIGAVARPLPRLLAGGDRIASRLGIGQ